MAVCLVVPIHVEALFVPKNDGPSRESRGSPSSPKHTNKLDKEQGKKRDSDNIPGETDSQSFQNLKLDLMPGVHLHWFLPYTLTMGAVEQESTSFPVVPNRWLVTRQDRTGVKQWVVESDYLHPVGQGEDCSAYPPDQLTVDPPAPDRRLGRKMSLEDWMQPQDPEKKYLDRLTAIGYGIPTFATYYPHCHSVFGFYDGDIQETFSKDLKYSVIGWYSDPADDILKTRRQNNLTTADVLKELDWRLPENLSDADPQRMFCYGVVSRELEEFRSEPRKIAVANNGVDALAAYLADAIAGGNQERKAQLEEQLEFLSIQPKLFGDKVDWDAKFIEAQHERGFDAVYGGSHWTIQPDLPPDPASSQTQKKTKLKLPPEFARQLGELNRRQREYDRTMQEITVMQQKLSSDLHKHMPQPDSSGGTGKGKPIINHAKVKQTKLFIEKQHIEPLNKKIVEQEKLKAELDSTQQTLEEAINQHNQKAGAELYVLNQIPAARYWQPKEPVVLIAGEGQPAFLEKIEGPLDCRIVEISGDVLTITKQTLDIILEQSKSPATSEEGKPWFLFLEWEVAFLPTDGGGSKENYPKDFITRNFELNNRKVGFEHKKPTEKEQESKLDKTAGEQKQSYHGASILAAHAGILLKQRVAKYIQTLIETKETEDLPGLLWQTADLDAWHESLVKHKSKKAGADKFQEWLGENIDDVSRKHEDRHKSMPGTYPSQADPISIYLKAFKILQNEEDLSQVLSGFNEQLMQEQTLQLSSADPLGSEPLEGESIPIRTGVMEIKQLRLVDTFGRIKDVPITDMIVSEHLRDPEDKSNQMALPPRLVQPMRLNFRWLAADAFPHAPDEMNTHPDTHPICGWLLPGFVDNSIMVYDSTGVALGSVTARAASFWQPAPDSNTTVEQIGNPYLKNVVEHIRNIGSDSDSLDQFIRELENALETIAPSSGEIGLALLLSRPIAVVRASLQLETFGLTTDVRALGDVRIPVRLGAKEQLNDGLIGYWLEDQQGAIPPAFLTPQTSIELAVNDPPQILTMLLDPHGKVHATSGILPVKAIDIPADQYAGVLDNLAVTFLATPILTGQNELNLPVSAEPGCGWAWLDSRDGVWKEIGPPTQQAFAAQQEIREVWLKLTPCEDLPNEGKMV